MTDYEVFNGRVPYSFQAPNFAVAAVATMMVGGGELGVKSMKDPDKAMPPMLAREKSEAWCQREFGMSRSQVESRVVRDWVLDLIGALKSWQKGLPGDAGLIEPPRDFSKRAHRLAKQVEEQFAQRVRRAQ